MSKPRRLVIASGNQGKIQEFQGLLSSLPLEVVAQPDNIDVEETGSTFAANARIKAKAVAKRTGHWALADDSGLEVDALGGAPGIHSARYASGEKQGNATDSDNNAKLLREMADVPEAYRGAQFRCVLALTPLGQAVRTELFEGICRGRISQSEAGGGGFGYDPLFIPDGFTQSFAELGSAIKNTLSHRAKALANLAAFF